MGRMELSHSKILFATSLSCQPTLSVSRHTISTICKTVTMENHLSTPKWAETGMNHYVSWPLGRLVGPSHHQKAI